MGYKMARLLTALVIVTALLVTACTSAATPTPAPTKPAAEATKPASSATKAPEASKPASEAAKPAGGPLPKSVTIATSTPGTTLNAMGTGLAKVASDAGQMQVIVQPFSGSPAYIPQMSSSGKPETAILNSVEAWQAFAGKATPKPLPEGVTVPTPYDKSWGNLRALLMGTDLQTGMLVKKDSKYQTMDDLKGARIAWGFKAHGGAALAAYTVAALGGLNSSNVRTVEVSDPAAAVRALAEGRIDAACVAIGMGQIAEADAQVGVRFLDLPNDPAKIQAVQGMMPGGRVVRAKGGSSAGVVKDTDVWGYPTVLMTSSNLPDNVAYTLVKTWWDNYEKLKPINAQFNDWKPEIYVSKMATLPYHPGAIAFYKEKGVWTPEMDQIQQQLSKGELPYLK
ncbi:MAG: TAXI family TRAP transporter solute-binding subunit [Chloroflexi bacterium]|nr:TAXI family TRAP transporter solute-binding subunit [Chloroflexota bacterium]